MATDNSSEEEKNNSSDESQQDNNSSDHESEKENNSDESKRENSKATVMIKKRKAVIKKSKSVVIKKRKMERRKEEDDTEETLQLLLRRNKKGDQEIPPGRIRVRIPDLVDLSDYSKCIYKQLTESDVSVSQNRLLLGKQEVKDNFLSRLQESEIPRVEGVDVLVYGPDGNVHEMKFNIRIKNTPVLTNGWIEFVQAYGLRKYSDFLTIWMFKATQDAKICFAITSNRYDITKQLSRRILNKVFKY